MLESRVVSGDVVGNEEGPASVVAVVLIALMEDVAVEKQGISWVELNMDQGQNLCESKSIVVG